VLLGLFPRYTCRRKLKMKKWCVRGEGGGCRGKEGEKACNGLRKKEFEKRGITKLLGFP
jgi:hypothetical protein